MPQLLEDASVIQRVLDHIDHKTTDVSVGCWREPVANYRSEGRLEAELECVLKATPTPFCPSAALPKAGSYLARPAAGVPLLAVHDDRPADAFGPSSTHCAGTGKQPRWPPGARARRSRLQLSPTCAWTYDLDGALRGVPHDYGFPDLDKACRGLVAVGAVEHAGLVFITQHPASPTASVAELPGEALQALTCGWSQARNQVTEANWKIVAEGVPEGYHIYATHRETFFPAQFDNLNVVERFGRNSRVTFPYRNIQKYRRVEPASGDATGVLTYVYHLFPNVIIATAFPQRTIVAILEPEGLARTRTVSYELARRSTLETDRPAVEATMRTS